MGAEMNEREALKLALEALDCICSPLHVREITKVGNAMKAIKEALAQSDQEPDDLTIAYMSGVFDGKNKYAPRREWIGLTEPEVDEAYKSVSNKEWAIGGLDDARVFFCAIEAKLREKNKC
jgi:hypothetical protein